MWKPIATVTVVAITGGAVGYALGSRAPSTNPAEVVLTATPDNTSQLELANAGLQREVRSCRRTVGRLIRERVAASPVAEAPVAIAAGDDAAPNDPGLPQEELRGEPILLRREYLDERIESVSADPEWQSSVDSAVGKVLSAWPGAETISTRCSKAVCRVDFITGQQENNLEAIMDQLNAMPEVQGERLIQVDDSVDPPVATAYFGRDGAISLATP